MTIIKKQTIRTGKGLFVIKVSCPAEILAGGTIRFSVFFLHERDGPVNPSNLTCKIYEGIQLSTLLSTLTIYQDIYGTGSYFSDYAVSSSQGTGNLTALWSGTYESQGTQSVLPVQAAQTFKVVNVPRI
ncbi:MAG: hypothetical protein ACYCQJ_02680 [Nitrososphaerales archaeon]